MGHQLGVAALFYEFSLDRHVPPDHLLRSIDRFVELDGLRRELSCFYSTIGRPSIAPELMIRMLLVGYCFGIRSERRLCDEVHLNLAYRWFCRLGLDGDVPDHSTFSKNRHGRFRDSDLLRRLFETILRRCIDEGLVGGESFAVDASLIKADANRQKGIEGEKRLPHKPQAAPSTSTWPFWTMRPLEPRPRSFPSSSHRLIQPHAGPVPMADRLSLLTRPTI
jgi:transposase